MDPTTLRSYIESARYRRDQAEQNRQSYEQQAQAYEEQARSYDEQVQKYRKYADDTRLQAKSYADEVLKAQIDMEYYGSQAAQAELDAGVAMQEALT